MDKYEKLEKLGEGAHGVVSKARIRSKQEIIAERKAHRIKLQQQLQEEEKSDSSSSLQSTPKKRKLIEAIDVEADEGEDEEDIHLPAQPDTYEHNKEGDEQ